MAIVRVGLIDLGPTNTGNFGPLNVPTYIKSGITLTVTGSAVFTNTSGNTMVGIEGWCWRFTIRTGHVMVHNAETATAYNGMFYSATEGERVGVIACIPGHPLSFFEVA